MNDQLTGISEGPEVDIVARLVSHAFAGPREQSAEWLRGAGLEHVRVLREEGRPVACLLRIPMAQRFGGVPVPMLGIAGVAVGPEARGRGLARRMMEACVREAAADGFAVSTLYASTQSLYRQVGYEQAGSQHRVRLPLGAIDVRERGGALRPLGPTDMDAVKACHERFARRFNGSLQRGPYIWRRIMESRGEGFSGFGIDGPDGTLDGYVFLAQRRKSDSGRHDVAVSDVAFLTAASGRRLLGFLADFATVGDDLLFQAGPHHPLLMLLHQQRAEVRLREYWMSRLCDVSRALGARGYSAAVTAEVHLQVEDTLLPDNHGRFTLRVLAGRPTVERGGRGELRCGARGLAAMYTGFITPAALELAGLCEGTPAALDAAAAVFDGGAPWTSDYF